MMKHFLVTFQHNKCLGVKEFDDDVKAINAMNVFYKDAKEKGYANVSAYTQKAESIDQIEHKPVEGLKLVSIADEEPVIVDQKKLIPKGTEVKMAFTHQLAPADSIVEADESDDKPAPKKKKAKAKDDE